MPGQTVYGGSCAGPGRGFRPGEVDVWAINRTGATVLKGEVVEFDLTQTVATNVTPGDPNSVFMVTVNPIAANVAFALSGVALDNALDGERMRLRIAGVCTVKVFEATDQLVKGSELDVDVANATERRFTSSGGAAKGVGILLEPYTTAGTVAYLSAFVDTFHGLE